MLKNQFECARTGQEFLKGVVKTNENSTIDYR